LIDTQLSLAHLVALGRYDISLDAESDAGWPGCLLMKAVLQPLSLLLKLSPLVDELALYDVVNTPGVAADLSHISSNAVGNMMRSQSSARG
jgi:hypothetical protein